MDDGDSNIDQILKTTQMPQILYWFPSKRFDEMNYAKLKNYLIYLSEKVREVVKQEQLEQNIDGLQICSHVKRS